MINSSFIQMIISCAALSVPFLLGLIGLAIQNGKNSTEISQLKSQHLQLTSKLSTMEIEVNKLNDVYVNIATITATLTYLKEQFSRIETEIRDQRKEKTHV